MLLVDSEIKTFLANGEIEDANQTFIKNGDPTCVTNIGYDLRAAYFAKDGKLVEQCELLPGESIFVQSEEIVNFDKYTAGRVMLKNGRIRMGLSLDAPAYQPGHTTKMFFRISNLSNNAITLLSGEKYAMLMFEQLDKAPDVPYSGAFDLEFSFKGLADYKSEYADQIKSINGKIKNLHDLEKSIYGNIITILSVFVAVFTLLNVNITLASQSEHGITFLIFNLATLGSISFLAVFLAFLLNKEQKPQHSFWLIPIFCFAAVFVVVCVSHFSTIL